MEKQSNGTLAGAAVGGTLGGGLGLIRHLFKTEAEKKQEGLLAGVLLNAIPGAAIGGVLGSTAESLGAFQPSPEVVRERLEKEFGKNDVSMHNMREHLAPIYAKAPGGLRAAVEMAQERMKMRDTGGSLGNFFGKRKPSDLDRQVPVVHTAPEFSSIKKLSGKTNLPPGSEADAMTYRRVPRMGTWIENYHNNVMPLLHELTHASIGSYGYKNITPTPPNSRILPAGFLGSKTRLVNIAQPMWNYMSTATELDPRIAETKRHYVKATGKHVNSTEEAEKAIQLYKNDFLNDKTKEEAGVLLDSIQGKARDAILRRMLELVRGGLTGRTAEAAA